MGIRDKIFRKSKNTLNNKNETIVNSDNKNKKEYVGMNHDVYVCYSTVDSEIANNVCHVLEQNNIKCWIAPRNICSDGNYVDEISDAIKSAKVIVLILSKNSQASKYVINEIVLAFAYKILIIPFLIDNFYPTGEIMSYIKTFNWLDAYSNPEESYGYLLNEVVNFCNSYHLSESDPLPPYNGEDKYIFVSYDYDDSDDVFPDIRKFQDLGYNVWYDDRKITNGEKSKKIRVSHLKRSDLCIVFVTNNSMASIQIQKEIKYAVKHNKNMIPIYLEDFDSIEM